MNRKGSIRDHHLNRCLAMAVHSNDISLAQELLGKGADPDTFAANHFDDDPEPLVCHAAGSRRTLILDLLLKAGADPSANEAIGLTALHYAVATNNTLGIYLLLKAGADPDARTLHGEAPLHFAYSRDAVALLLEHGADPNGRGRNGGRLESRYHMPLHEIAKWRDDLADAAALLIRNGARPNHFDTDGRAALHIAAMSGCPNIIRVLAQHGAKVNAQDRLGRTALHLATMLGRVKAMQSLIENGASVSLRDWEGNTPLHHATMLPSPECTKLLLAVEGKPNLSNFMGRTPLELSVGRRKGRGCLSAVALLEVGALAPPWILSRLVRFAVRRAANLPEARALIDCACWHGAKLSVLRDEDFVLMMRANDRVSLQIRRPGIRDAVLNAIRAILDNGGSIPPDITARLL